MNSEADRNRNTKIKSTFADIWGQVDPFESGLDSVKIDVSVMLCSLLSQAGVSRTQLADQLGWKPSRVTRVLSGDENLTLKTIYEICHAAGMTFDVVARKPNERPALQPWQRTDIEMDIVQAKQSIHRHLNEAEAILATAISLAKRQFRMAADWKQSATTQVSTYSQTLAANDEAHDVALAS